jgi:4'-phosphopantetheinyl transferase
MDVYWLEQTEADVPRDLDWLSASEAARLNGMRFAKRRADWRLGRWTAKRALAVYLNVPVRSQALADIELRPAPSGAPEVFFANKPAAVSVSLSHRAGSALCAVALCGAALGCDLEIIEPRSDAFVADYFTPEEQALVTEALAPDRPRLLALLWSAKESALKALRVGLRVDARCVIVSPVDVGCPAEGGYGRAEDPALAMQASDGVNSWRPLHVRCTDDQLFHGWWHNTGHLLRTIVTAPPPAPPIPLRIPT